MLPALQPLTRSTHGFTAQYCRTYSRTRMFSFVPLLLKLRPVQELFKDGTWRESIKGSAKREETPWSASKGRRVAISVGVRAARNCKRGDIPCNRGTLTTNSTDKCTLLFVCCSKVQPHKDYVTVLAYPTLRNLVQGYWVWLACSLVTAAC